MEQVKIALIKRAENSLHSRFQEAFTAFGTSTSTSPSDTSAIELTSRDCATKVITRLSEWFTSNVQRTHYTTRLLRNDESVQCAIGFSVGGTANTPAWIEVWTTDAIDKMTGQVTTRGNYDKTTDRATIANYWAQSPNEALDNVTQEELRAASEYSDQRAANELEGLAARLTLS
jgi:hypothetical protein